MTDGRHRWRPLALALVLAAAAAPAPAHAALLGSREVGRSARVLGTDGDRFAAWRTADDRATAVYDARSRRTRTIADPPGCREPVIGSRSLLYTCGAQPLPGARVLDLVTGRQREVVAAGPANGDGRSRTWVAVGGQWLQSEDLVRSYDAPSFFRRSTGTPYRGVTPFGPTSVADLSRAGLARRLCAPVQRRLERTDMSDLTDPYESTQLTAGWVLTSRSDPETADASVRLHRCGSPAARSLCSGLCDTPLLTSTHALWQDTDGLRSLRLADGRRTLHRLATTRLLGLWRLGAGLLLSTDPSPPPSTPHAVRIRVVGRLR